MKTELEQLDKHLQEKRPDYYSQLQKPLIEDEIVNLERKYSIKLPTDVKELYLWKNGQNYNNYKSFVNNSMFQDLEAVLSENKELTRMIGFDFEIENWWNKDWLPIFSNGGGSSICYDTVGVFTGKNGQLIEYWNKDNDRNVIAPTLADFISVLNNYYKETPVENFDSYFDFSEKIVKWKKRFVVDKPIKNN